MEHLKALQLRGVIGASEEKDVEKLLKRGPEQYSGEGLEMGVHLLLSLILASERVLTYSLVLSACKQQICERQQTKA